MNNGALNIDNYQQNTQKDFANENFNQNHENLRNLHWKGSTPNYCFSLANCPYQNLI